MYTDQCSRLFPSRFFNLHIQSADGRKERQQGRAGGKGVQVARACRRQRRSGDKGVQAVRACRWRRRAGGKGVQVARACRRQGCAGGKDVQALKACRQQRRGIKETIGDEVVVISINSVYILYRCILIFTLMGLTATVRNLKRSKKKHLKSEVIFSFPTGTRILKCT